MQDNQTVDVSVARAANTEGAPLRDNPAPLSDAFKVPTLLGEFPGYTNNEPAPLSDALHIPTLVGGIPNAWREAARLFASPRISNSSVRTFDVNRATTPAGPPGSDAGTLFGVPSNHLQTPVSARLASLDKAALALGALIIIGPLFAAMVSRSMGG